MADTLESTGNYLPKDLQITSQPDSVDKDKFKVVATGLKIDSQYAFQFQYVYPDGTVSEWSPGYSLLTDAIATLPKPKLTSANVTYFQGILKVTWDGTDYNNTPYGNGFSRILIWVRDNSTPGQLFKIIGELTKPGTWSLAVPPKSQTVKLSAVTVNGEESAYSDEFTITPAVAPPSTPTGITAAWSGTDFTVSFTHDPSASANEYLKEYLITLNTATSGTKIFSLLPVSGTSQKFSLSLPQNQAAFGTAVQAFSGNVQTVDIYGNKGTAGSFTNTAYVSALTTPTITVAATTNGYTVSYPAQTSNTFQFISIEEVESNASTDPGTGYSGIATGSVNPIFVPAANTNKRWVRARLYDTLNTATGYSTAVAVTPLSPVTVDNTGPDNVSSVTATGGIDTTGTLGFNGFINISWPAVTGGGIRGYRIRFRPVSTPASSYAYVDSPGSGTSYRLSGLTVGSTSSPVVYEIAVATYDEYNNTSSSYVSATNVSISGTPAITDYITAGNFQFGQGVDPTNATGTGTGMKRGLFFDASNYWFLNALNSARLKVGGSTTNYLLWDGSEFVIDGDLRARKGNFSGNVQIASGGSLYSGTLSDNSLSGAGFIINNSGLTFNSSSVNGITTIDGSTGLLTTSSANIGGWLINPVTNAGSLYKTSGTNTVRLNSTTGAIEVSGTGYTAGVGLPDGNNIVFWAGGSRAETANFWVKQDGSAKLGSVTITGYATSSDLTSGLGTKIGAADVNANVTSISGGVITTGAIQSTNYSAPTVPPASNPTTPYSVSGTRFNIADGSIVSKNFVINADGSAAFKGTLSSGISIDAPVITGGQINIGNGTFQVTTAGALIATSATINGTIRATGGYIGGTTSGWLIGSGSISGGGVTLNSSGSIVISATDSFTGAIQTTTLANGNISMSNNGTSFLSSNSISISGRNLAGEVASTSMAPAYFSLTNPNHTGIITMNGNFMQIYGGSGMTVEIGGGGVLTNLAVDGRLSVLGGFNTTGGTVVAVGSSLSTGAIRNISAGTGTKTSSDTDGLLGDIWIQYS